MRPLPLARLANVRLGPTRHDADKDRGLIKFLDSL